jgi:hypothetical protein
MRKEVPIAIAAIAGFVVLFEYFFSAGVPVAKTWATSLQNWGTVVSAFAMGLAAANLLVIHGRRLRAQNPEWYNSAALVLGMAVMAAAGIFGGDKSKLWQFLFSKFFVPAGAAMFSLMIFFIASASRRAFRARNLEAAVLLLAGILVMLGRAPIGELISQQLPKSADWLMKVPNLAGNRGILIGAALGMVATGFRVLVGIDRAYLGGE